MSPNFTDLNVGSDVPKYTCNSFPLKHEVENDNVERYALRCDGEDLKRTVTCIDYNT